MSDDALRPARELEASGRLDEAVAAFLAAGAPGEAVRVLVAAQRFAPAGRLMLESLGVRAEDAGTLEGPARQAAIKAARVLELGGDLETARRVRVSLGLESIAAPPGASRSPVKISGITRSVPLRSAAPPAPSAASVPPSPPPIDPAPPVRVSAPPPAPAPIAPAVVASAPSVAPPAAAPTPTPTPTPAKSVAPPPRAPDPPRWNAAPTTPKGERLGSAKGWRTGQVDPSAMDEMIRQLLERGKRSAAARVAWDCGRLEDAAKWFRESSMHYETGAVLFDMGRDEEAMEELLQVAPDHKRYRTACAKLIELSGKVGRFDFELDRMLSHFTKAPPIEPIEVATYTSLADLYTKNGFAEGARRVLEQILAFEPGNEAARDALAAVTPARDTKSLAPARRARAPIATGRALAELPPLAEFVAEARKRRPTAGT